MATPEDRLFFLLTYLKTYAVQVVQGRLFGMSQSKANQLSCCRRCSRRCAASAMPPPASSRLSRTGWLSRRGRSRRWRSLRPPQPPHPELGGAPPLYGAFDVKRFPIQPLHFAYPYVRPKGPSLRPDHDRARARRWAEVKDGPQGHRRRRRPASLRSAHHRATLGWLGSDDWPAWWGSRSKAEFSRPWTAARSNNLVFGPAHGRRP